MKHFNFQENLKYLSRSDLECMYKIRDGRIYLAIETNGESQLVEISEGSNDDLHIRLLKGSGSGVDDYVRDWFDLDTDLAPFYELAAQDPLLAEPARQFHGLRLIGIPDLFEAMSWGILGQQINLTFAYTLKRRFVEQFGSTMTWNGEDFYKFPKPEIVAQCSVEDLQPMKMSRKKCEYLIEVAKLISEGRLSKEALLSDLDNAEKTLTSIRGIGPWTAHYILMRCLRSRRAFPIDDVGFQNAIKLVLDLDEKPSKPLINDYAKKWGGYEAYAVFYLWRLLY